MMDLREEMEGRSGPYELEQKALATLAELLPQREAETDKRQRKQLSSRIKTCRMLVKWCRTRVGYRVPE